MASRNIRQTKLDAATVGLSGVTLASERTSNNIICEGYNQCTVFVNLSAQSAATDVQVDVDTSDDEGTTWFPLQSVSIASGTGTLSDLQWTKAVSGADTFAFDFPINYERIRLRVDGTSGGASDVVTVTVQLGSI